MDRHRELVGDVGHDRRADADADPRGERGRVGERRGGGGDSQGRHRHRRNHHRRRETVDVPTGSAPRHPVGEHDIEGEQSSIGKCKGHAKGIVRDPHPVPRRPLPLEAPLD